MHRDADADQIVHWNKPKQAETDQQRHQAVRSAMLSVGISSVNQPWIYLLSHATLARRGNITRGGLCEVDPSKVGAAQEQRPNGAGRAHGSAYRGCEVCALRLWRPVEASPHKARRCPRTWGCCCEAGITDAMLIYVVIRYTELPGLALMPLWLLSATAGWKLCPRLWRRGKERNK